ncbi:MAG: GTPase ObgE [Dehalococcoidia bacterium]|nr:GTPase ObgE [Dehalococcoidia bacterium]
MFVDKVEISVQAGNGGSGLAGFRREKYLPFGGPDGGDGGKGGNIFVIAKRDVVDLGFFRHKTVFKAANGKPGGKQKKHGSDAADLAIEVPIGTSIYSKSEEKEIIIADLQKDNQSVVVARGGKGGLGNVHFATATNQAPKTAQPGESGEKANLVLRFKITADVCIIGYPNSGKSSLLAALSKARPEIAEYPFTTREPVLGVVEQNLKQYTWAELPGLIRDAHKGKGLGNSFLSHAEKARAIVYLIDGQATDMEQALRDLVDEVALFGSTLSHKKCMIAVNKIDTPDLKEGIMSDLEKLRQFRMPVVAISVNGSYGLQELVTAVHELVDEEKRSDMQKMEEPEVIFRPSPRKARG